MGETLVYKGKMGEQVSFDTVQDKRLQPVMTVSRFIVLAFSIVALLVALVFAMNNAGGNEASNVTIMNSIVIVLGWVIFLVLIVAIFFILYRSWISVKVMIERID